MHTFPFSALCDDMLIVLVYATHWLFMYLYTLAYMFMHESCLLVCHPCFSTMKSWTFDPNLHLSLADTPFCVFSLLVCPLCLLVSFLLLSHAMLAISILLVCFASLCFYLRFFLLLFFCWFSYLCLCMYTCGARMHRART